MKDEKKTVKASPEKSEKKFAKTKAEVKVDVKTDVKVEKTKTEVKAEKPAKEKKEIVAKKETKPAKISKTVKTVPTKKLPKLYVKSYTEKQLNKKIYSKLFIPDDINYIKSLFKESGKNKKEVVLYSIPSDLLFDKKEVARLKTLALEIKENKSRIKWAPLIATVSFVAAVVIVISLTKNIVAKKVIESTCESIFEAKCDVGSVNIKFFDSTFSLKRLEVANKKEPMKNLFSVDSVTFDFDMLQLLKARFVANELSILGVDTNTDRKYSGDISAKKAAKIQKKKEKQAKKAAKQNSESEFMKAVKGKSDVAMNTIKDSVSGVFDQYNPENIVKNVSENLKTPVVSKDIQEQVKELVEKYKAKPGVLDEKTKEVQASINTISSINIDSIKSDPTKIKDALDSINSVKNDVESLKNEVEKTLNEVQADSNSVTKMGTSIQDAINSDKNLVTSEINKITSLRLDDGMNFISGTFDSVLYQVLGDYYPYYTKLMTFIESAKNSEKKDKKKKEKKTATVIHRSEGRMVYYKNDSAPKLWIKKAAGSGPSFSFTAAHISNDMDKTGKPATADVLFNFKDIDHSAKLTADTRSTGNNPIITADYSCNKLPLAYPASKFGNIPGVPGIDSSVSKLDFTFKVFEKDGFSLSGNGLFNQMVLSAPAFEPKFAYDIFANTLSSINTMSVGVKAGYTASSGLDLKLTTDADKRFMNAFSAEMTNQLGIVKEKAEAEIVAKINQFSNGALGEINSFNDIYAKLNSYKDEVNKLTDKLDAKRREIEEATTAKVKGAVDDATNNAKKAANDAVNGAVNNLKDSAKSKLKLPF